MSREIINLDMRLFGFEIDLAIKLESDGFDPLFIPYKAGVALYLLPPYKNCLSAKI